MLLFAALPASHARSGSAHVGLDGLDGLDEPAEHLARPAPERRAQLVQERPRRLIAADFRALLELQRRDPLLVPREEEDRQKPDAQGLPRLVEDRPRRDRRLIAATPALIELARLDEVTSSSAAARTDEPAWPALPAQESPAALLVRKAILELDQRPRKPHAVSLLWEPASHRRVTHPVTG